eukprot:CAMPEP_0116924696 /NCGR_PEP_ID=MMETSP0467-20121206/23672_1 /TAXON_ID=283647 /ORGANISM="Mesodinium pulex, Strain SPMC105" /LENGTH=53 /DNA_ID=CAMNT_0004603589 /DNA_START=8 /DNA_END=166 /DNA_ORIENTATION=+
MSTPTMFSRRRWTRPRFGQAIPPVKLHRSRSTSQAGHIRADLLNSLRSDLFMK